MGPLWGFSKLVFEIRPGGGGIRPGGGVGEGLGKGWGGVGQGDCVPPTRRGLEGVAKMFRGERTWAIAI